MTDQDVIVEWGRCDCAGIAEYDGETDFARAWAYGFAVIRERVAAGGDGWQTSANRRLRRARRRLVEALRQRCRHELSPGSTTSFRNEVSITARRHTAAIEGHRGNKHAGESR
jgi:hypothetical protein